MTMESRQKQSRKEEVKPLPNGIILEINPLQSRWSDEVDMHAELWSM